MSTHLTRSNAVIPLIAGQDLTGRRGCAVKIVADKAELCAAADKPVGVLLSEGALGEQVTVALHAGLAGTVLVRLIAAVNAVGQVVQTAVAGADYGFRPSIGAPGWEFAIALEAGTAGEMIEAVLIPPNQIVE